MTDRFLSTQPYKGVRDFYPEDMAALRYITDRWAKTAESFGFARYGASLLESADLYKSKGAANEEIVKDQTYTFTDRGGREVTLRPEMTPTVARMVAHRRRELVFPLRWYAIPNLFRYERPQRGRLREHWQFNCDIFGTADRMADAEIILIAYQTLIDFGATPDMFSILINDRAEMTKLYQSIGILNEETIVQITRLTDRKKKMTSEAYRTELLTILDHNHSQAEQVISLLETESTNHPLLTTLRTLGVTNAVIDRTIARGFDYYTGMVFEVIDNDQVNNRALMGGGRYSNLTKLFSPEEITGVGFGMGDVTMRDFLETHKLLPESITNTAPTLVIIPAETTNYLAAETLALAFRQRGIQTAVDIGEKKLGKKISDAAASGVRYALVAGETEFSSTEFVIKDLSLNTTETGNLETLITWLIAQTY